VNKTAASAAQLAKRISDFASRFSTYNSSSQCARTNKNFILLTYQAGRTIEAENP